MTRPRTVLTAVLGLALLANGAVMLLAPAPWYALVPGVGHTGPLNPHFVRDIGCAYLVIGGGLLAFAVDARARPAALAGGVFLALHALVHAWDVLAGREHAGQLLGELPTVFAPAVLALWLALPLHRRPYGRSTIMLNWLIHRRLDAFERRYGYDVTYLRDLLSASWRGFLALIRLQGLSDFRQEVPTAPWYAAKLTAALAEDCGPCVQLVVAMAEEAGVAADELRAILAGDTAALPPDTALGLRFAVAVLRHDAEADALREAVLRRWGQAGLVSLAFAIASARLYPTVKYALGHGRSCQRVIVGGDPAPVVRKAA